MKDDISNFSHTYQDNASDIARFGRAVQKGIISFASLWGLEEVARSLLQKWGDGGATKKQYQDLINRISAQAIKYNSIAANRIDEAQRTVDSLQQLGFYVSGSTMSILAKMKAKAQQKLTEAKTSAERLSANLSNVQNTLESNKPLTDSDYNTRNEVDRMNQAAKAATKYMEDIANAYEKQQQ